MKPIDDYTIYCTEEQTKKAMEFGAPIVSIENAVTRKEIPHFFTGELGKEWTLYFIPTAEQMTGWLRKKGLHVQVMIYGHKSYYCALYKVGSFEDAERISDVFDTYEQAILAAIDAALEYLEKHKEEQL